MVHIDFAFSNKMEFNISDSDANDWTPEGGFHSNQFDVNKYSYPRPAAGKRTKQFFNNNNNKELLSLLIVNLFPQAPEVS